MMRRLLPPTQIDLILKEIALHTNPIRLVDIIEPHTSVTQSSNNFDFDQLETQRIFHLNQIRKVCIDYRLRFLDLKYFKGNIPKEGINKITQLEKEHQTSLEGFKIMAPSVLFRLKKTDDPLLFVPLGNNYFYLVHKWGNDLSFFRKASSIARLCALVLYKITKSFKLQFDSDLFVLIKLNILSASIASFIFSTI